MHTNVARQYCNAEHGHGYLCDQMPHHVSDHEEHEPESGELIVCWPNEEFVDSVPGGQERSKL